MTRSISLGGTIGFTINKLDDNLKDLLSELCLNHHFQYSFVLISESGGLNLSLSGTAIRCI